MTSGLLAVASAALLGALPPPPAQVVLSGRGSFGEVSFDHAAHLARRIACKSCHGGGPVRRPELTPGLAHETCRACHVALARGPTGCRECHRNVKADESAAPTALPPSAPPERASTSPPVRGPYAQDARGESKGTPTAPPRADLGGPSADGAIRAVHGGVAVIGGSSRSGPGLVVRATVAQGSWVVGSELDWTNRAGAQRALALVTAGVQKPIGRSTDVRAVALCGLDMGEPAYVLPVVGGGIGVEWSTRRGAFSLVPSADVSISVLSALGSRVDGAGQRTGETALVLSLLLGWRLPAP